MKLDKKIEMLLHAKWVLTLQPGDKVLTNWNEDLAEYASMLPIESDRWRELTIREVKEVAYCGSSVSVSFQEYPEGWDYEIDSSWIKPLEVTHEA